MNCTLCQIYLRIGRVINAISTPCLLPVCSDTAPSCVEHALHSSTSIGLSAPQQLVVSAASSLAVQTVDDGLVFMALATVNITQVCVAPKPVCSLGVSHVDYSKMLDNVCLLQEVELWWPNGHGAQRLYNLIVDLQLTPGDAAATSGAAAPPGDTFHYNRTIGFRTVELVQDPIGNDKGACAFEFVHAKKARIVASAVSIEYNQERLETLFSGFLCPLIKFTQAAFPDLKRRLTM